MTPIDPTMQIYLAQLAYQRQGQMFTELGADFLFRSVTAERAAEDVWRWWVSRNEDIPDHFHRLLAVKLYRASIGEVGPDGYLEPQNNYQILEWKCDTAGCSYPVFVEEILPGQLARRQPLQGTSEPPR